MNHIKRCLLFLAISFPLSLFALASIGYGQTPSKGKAFEAIDRNKAEIAKVGDAIYYFAELGMQEIETSKLCAEVLKSMGYKVETGISGFPTAIMATYGSGEPVIAVHMEYDAIPSVSQTPGVVERREIVKGAPGHAEGHNTNAAVWIGAAFAVKEAIDKRSLRGTIKLFSAPAEEQLVSRPFFVRDGYFKDVDASFHPHVSVGLFAAYGLRQYALMSVEYEFFGKTTHSSRSPWLGASAVDAVKIMDNGWDVLRKHLRPTQRSYSVILSGGVQPNVVPDYGKIWFFFREATYEGANDLYVKAKKIAEGAALMTGTTWKETILSACWPTRDNQTMAEIVKSNMDLVGMPAWTPEEQTLAKAIQKAAGVKETGLFTRVAPLREARQDMSSNDSGDITWTTPHAEINFPSNIPGMQWHHWTAGIATATSIAHKGEVAGAKVLAGSIIDLLTKPELLAKAKETFKKEVESATYRPLLPPDQKPPLTLNVEEMAKYRDLMRPHYLRVPIQFK